MLTLRTLALSLLLTIVVASVGSGLLLDKLYSEFYKQEPTQKELLPSQIEVIGKQLSTILQKIDNKEEFIQAWQAENAPLFLEVLSKDEVRIPEEILQKLKFRGYITFSSSTNISFYSELKESENFVVLRSPFNGQDSQPKWLPIFFSLFFYALLMLIVFLWLAPLIRRLQTLRTSAKKLGEGDLKVRIIPSTISYINDIELEFNRMAQRIEELVSDISLLSSTMSHEMRAPLAKLQFGLDALREEVNEEERSIYHDRLDKVIGDMTSLIDILLKYARLDKNITQLPKEDVDLLDISKRLLASVSRDGREDNSGGRAITLDLDAQSPFYLVKGDAFYLRLLIENLLSNAIKYGHGKIRLGLHQDQNGIVFSIEDDGPGIDEKFKQDIFKPFIRGEKTKNEPGIPSVSEKGYGLGMALVKRIADLHNIDIMITKSEILGGAKFVLLFMPSDSLHPSATN